ncbi:uncharacterized protein LOC110447315 [Mizuhopecten yessoensis]|uniref:Uncharacterized protein n=1 Tax=Mizuhopecten yessoensis TaxID=6573 RepID=A0A210QVP1_MIZYE|nr:uncharacterized protein LOC110447315 [Mizuhopecten yessoensis]OWF52784.1 hypothetical protein KP79_PYT17571 [Mizuhopecten yessoensis]
MGCKFTKVRDQRSRDDDGKISEVISQSSSFTDSKTDLECHTAPATREIVEKCQQAMSEANTQEEEVLSLHMYPPDDIDEHSDAMSVTAESEMDISFYKEEVILDRRGDTPLSDVSSMSEISQFSSRFSSRLSDFFRRGKRSKLNAQSKVPLNGDYGRGDGNEDDISSSECDRSPTPFNKDTKKATHEKASELIGNVQDGEEMPDPDIEDDGRPSSSSSSEDSVFHPQFNCRVLARPNAARGSRNLVQATPDPAEIAHRIVKFEADVEQLISEHALPTRDYQNRQLRPMGARGPRLPSYSLRFQKPRAGVSSETVSGRGMMYSKHFANTMSRPQLTVRGLSATDDCLTQWMVSQQSRDYELL